MCVCVCVFVCVCVCTCNCCTVSVLWLQPTLVKGKSCVVPSGTFLVRCCSISHGEDKKHSPKQYAEAMIALLPKVTSSSSSSGCDDAAPYRKLFAEALEEMILDESSVVSVLSQLRARRETRDKAKAELSLLPPMPVVGKSISVFCQGLLQTTQT